MNKRQYPIRNDLIEEERLQEKVRRLEAKKQSVPGDAGYDLRKCALCGEEQPEKTMIVDHSNGKFYCSDRKACWARYDMQNDLLEVKG